LSDTVGFVSDLPTMLVAAFRATLEEVIEADIILHVRDISHPDTEAQANDVCNVLEELGIDLHAGRIIEVWNKIDRMTSADRELVSNRARRGDLPHIPVSALTGEGIDALKTAIEDKIAASRETFDVALDAADGARASWLYRNAEVLDKHMSGEGTLTMTIRVDPAKAGMLLAKFGNESVRRVR
jgi:GTP-binding protein HflX